VQGWQASPERFQVAAVVDLNADRAREAAEKFGVAEALTDVGAILGRPDIDIVDIATPPAYHLELAEAALAAGHHVVVEKPLVASLADCDRLQVAANAAKGRLMPVFQYRWGDGYRQMQHLVAAGIAGRLHAATVETHWTRGPDYYAVPWRGKRATELGGCLTTHAIHAHDLLRGIAGDYASVFCRTATRINPIEVEDCAAAVVTTQDGALCTLSVTLGTAGEISRLRLVYEHLTAESSLSPYAPGDAPWTFTPTTEAVGERVAAALDGFPAAPRRFAGQFAAFADALDAGRPPPVTIADARASLELLTALYHSAATGLAVGLPIGPTHPRYRGWN
jgi:predicted dehydrogenase